MTKRPMWTFGVLALLSCMASAQAISTLKLASGKQIKVIKAGPVIGAGGKRLGVMLQYETELKVTDKAALRTEADEVFAAVRSDAEKGNETEVIISAVERSTGVIISKSQGYNFVFEKAKDGKWHCLDDQK